MVWWHWLIAITGIPVFLIVGRLAHPREGVRRVCEGTLCNPKHAWMLGKDHVSRAAKDNRPPWER